MERDSGYAADALKFLIQVFRGFKGFVSKVSKTYVFWNCHDEMNCNHASYWQQKPELIVLPGDDSSS